MANHRTVGDIGISVRACAMASKTFRRAKVNVDPQVIVDNLLQKDFNLETFWLVCPASAEVSKNVKVNDPRTANDSETVATSPFQPNAESL